MIDVPRPRVGCSHRSVLGFPKLVGESSDQSGKLQAWDIICLVFGGFYAVCHAEELMLGRPFAMADPSSLSSCDRTSPSSLTLSIGHQTSDVDIDIGRPPVSSLKNLDRTANLFLRTSGPNKKMAEPHRSWTQLQALLAERLRRIILAYIERGTASFVRLTGWGGRRRWDGLPLVVSVAFGLGEAIWEIG